MGFMATFIEMAKTYYPKPFNIRDINPTSGISLLATFKRKKNKGHNALFNEHFKSKYIRDSEWNWSHLTASTLCHSLR